MKPAADLGPAVAALGSPFGRWPGQAPGDAGDPAETHDFVMRKNGVASTFVWIPPFDAYQLVVPGNCGPDNASKPTGAWVKDRPPAGTEGADWAQERFGGFYAGKYEASRADARPGGTGTGAGATPGGSPILKVAPSCVPWTDVDLDGAIAACQAYDPHADLLADDEWTALAVWAMIHGVAVQGNNDHLRDADDPATRFTDDPNVPSVSVAADGKNRALTGTGANPAWLPGQNLTTHTGTTAGVHDLNGNVWEWTGTVGLDGAGRWVVRVREVGVLAPATGSIAGLATAPEVRRFGTPGVTAAAPSSFFGGDTFPVAPLDNVRSMRGGSWEDTRRAGLWRFFLVSAGYADGDVGFRPVLRY